MNSEKFSEKQTFLLHFWVQKIISYFSKNSIKQKTQTKQFGFSIEVGLLGLPSTTLGTGFSPNNIRNKKTQTKQFGFSIEVGLLGLEPRLFCTKNRRVASYTIGQYFNTGANLKQTLFYTNIFRVFYQFFFSLLF